jgi:hypothetical protein
VIAAAFPQPGNMAYVPVLIEVDGTGLLAGSEQAVLELYAYALRPDGTVAAHFNQNLGLDPAKIGDKVRASGVKYWGHVMLPPGDYSLRVLARNTQTGRSALRVTPVSVPLAGAEPVLAAPLFPEPQDAWLLIPEAQRPNVAFPFMMGEAPFIPAARPKLPRQGTTTLQLVGYNLPQGRLVGGARLVGADGATVPGATLRLGGRQDAPDGGPSRVAAELETSGLAPGVYTLVVTLGAEGGAAETAALPVVVGG